MAHPGKPKNNAAIHNIRLVDAPEHLHRAVPQVLAIHLGDRQRQTIPLRGPGLPAVIGIFENIPPEQPGIKSPSVDLRFPQEILYLLSVVIVENISLSEKKLPPIGLELNEKQ